MSFQRQRQPVTRLNPTVARLLHLCEQDGNFGGSGDVVADLRAAIVRHQRVKAGLRLVRHVDDGASRRG